MEKYLESQDSQASKEFLLALEAFSHYNAGLLTLAAHFASDIGITLSEAVINDHLRLFGPLTPGELAKRARLSSGAVTALLDRLEARGFVERKPHPGDRRSLLIHYVPQEPKLVGRLYAVMEGFRQEFDELDEGGKKAVQTFLSSMAKVVMSVALEEKEHE